MHFDKCKHPCNHHSKQDIDYSHHSKKLPLPLPSHFYVYTHSETITVVNSSIAVDQFYLFLNFICRGSYIFSLLHLGGHTSISGSTPEEIKRLKTTLKKWEKKLQNNPHCSVSVSRCVYTNIYSYVFSSPFSPKSFKPNCFLLKKNSHMFQDIQDLPLMWPGMLCLLCLPQTDCTCLYFHVAHVTLKVWSLSCDIHTVYMMIKISLCSREGLKDAVVL